MKEKELIQILTSPNGPEAAKKQGVSAEEVLELLKQTNETRVQAAALSFLVREGKTKAGREVTCQKLSDKALAELAGSGDPKVRKNAARLIGVTERKTLDQVLADTLRRESVRMVRPSQILALGALQTEAARKVLETYQVQAAADESEAKHVKEETEALRKARAAFVQTITHRFTGIKPLAYSNVRCRLGCERGFETALAEEVQARKAADEIVKIAPGSVTVEGTDWERLQQVRSFREVLMPLSRQPLEKKTCAPLLAEKLSKAMACMHEGKPPYRFRLETGGREGTAELAAQIEASSGGQLLNAPGHYECELRLAQAEGGRVFPYLKLFTAEDHRYEYRKLSIPASIHPAAAAGLMWLAKPYLKKGAAVLDPCCGSGTLLQERARLSEARPSRVIGCDISAKALDAARLNSHASDAVRANNHANSAAANQLPRQIWIHSDLAKLSLKEPVDELFANLPFGNRVGNHESNVALYRKLADKIPEWVKPGGVAVLYTMEGKLLEKELGRVKGLKLLQKTSVEAGGLKPVVFIVRID